MISKAIFRIKKKSKMAMHTSWTGNFFPKIIYNVCMCMYVSMHTYVFKYTIK